MGDNKVKMEEKTKNKVLSDTERYERDRASVMSMLKFILMVAIIAGLAYAGKIVVVILVPFLIGFLLSKTSVLIAKPISKAFDKDATKIKPGKKKSTHTKTSITVYVILNIVVFILIVLALIGLIYQANSLLVTLGELTRTIKPAEMVNTQILDRFSSDNGGFLTPDMIESLKESVTNMGQTIANKAPTFINDAFSAVGRLVGNLPYAVFFVISIVLSGFYFINDGPAVMKFFVKNTPNKKFLPACLRRQRNDGPDDDLSGRKRPVHLRGNPARRTHYHVHHPQILRTRGPRKVLKDAPPHHAHRNGGRRIYLGRCRLFARTCSCDHHHSGDQGFRDRQGGRKILLRHPRPLHEGQGRERNARRREITAAIKIACAGDTLTITSYFCRETGKC